MAWAWERVTKIGKITGRGELRILVADLSISWRRWTYRQFPSLALRRAKPSKGSQSLISQQIGVTLMTKTRIFLAGAIALAFSAGTVALPSLADAGQTLHGGGGHGGGSYHGGGGYGCRPAQVVLGLCSPYGY
jgi:hypothetical protein